LDSGHHLHQLLGSLSGAGGPAGFYREEENRAPAKGTVGEAIPSHCQDAGRLPAVSADQPRSQSGSHFLEL